MEKNNLIENIRDFFKEKYDGIKDSESFLSFEPVGSAIDIEDFKDSFGNVSEQMAIEQLSIIGDRLPEIDDLYITDTSSLSDSYKLLIDTAEFNTEYLDDGVLPIYAEKIDEARQNLEGFESASLITPQGEFLPIQPSIDNWFESEGSFWTKKEFSTQEEESASDDKKAVKPKQLKPLNWRFNIADNPALFKTLKAVPVKKSTKKATLNVNKSFTPLLLNTNVSKVLRANQKVKKSKLKLKKNKRQDALALRPKTSQVNIKPIQWQGLKNIKHLALADRLQVTSKVVASDTTPPKPVDSDHFKMSFWYCIVNLHRPWIDRSLFDVADWWYCKGLDAGFFSTGEKSTSNNGKIKCYTTAMILIKDLEISAAWTERDKEMAKQNGALENFNISNAEFHGNTLKTKGIQIIGWICNVLPKLPSTSGPSH
ncbi:MAG: hypothetical protein AAF901_02945 [Bacteroidota bacterium]